MSPGLGLKARFLRATSTPQGYRNLVYCGLLRIPCACPAVTMGTIHAPLRGIELGMRGAYAATLPTGPACVGSGGVFWDGMRVKWSGGGGGGGCVTLHLAQSPQRGCSRMEGTSEPGPKSGLDRRLEEVAKAVGGGYCRLQMLLRWRDRGWA